MPHPSFSSSFFFDPKHVENAYTLFESKKKIDMSSPELQ